MAKQINKIKALLMYVDGVLSDAEMYYFESFGPRETRFLKKSPGIWGSKGGKDFPSYIPLRNME